MLVGPAIILTILFTSAPSVADNHFFFWKVFAGDFGTASKYEWREARRNTRAGVVVSDFSDVECKRNARFGIIYNILFENHSPVSYETIWYFPHLEEAKKGKTSHAHQNTARRQPKESSVIRGASWYLDKDEMEDGDFILIIRRKEIVLLQHVFRIRGCEPAES